MKVKRIVTLLAAVATIGTGIFAIVKKEGERHEK